MKKKALIITMCCVLLFSFVLSVFAIEPTSSMLLSTPDDLGSVLTSIDSFDSKLHKYYLKIQIKNFVAFDIPITAYSYNGSFVNQSVYVNNITAQGMRFPCSFYTYNSVIISTSYFLTESDFTSDMFVYIPIFVYNIGLQPYEDSDCKVTIYSALNDGTLSALQEYYNIGYQSGFSDAITGTEDLNLVQHINRAVAFFIGDEYAPYITPFAIAFTLFLAYLIFIRWILMFAKKSKAMKIADIIVVSACIGIIAVMYINMLTINIQNHNLNESVYQIASDIVSGG